MKLHKYNLDKVERSDFYEHKNNRKGTKGNRCNQKLY